jgi:uncharacterized protein YbjT (DUF2867 family)
MAIFVTAATGYIGGSIAARLVADGREVRGLVCTEEKARLLAQAGVTPVLGDLGNSELLSREAQASDAVVSLPAGHSSPNRNMLTLRGTVT